MPLEALQELLESGGLEFLEAGAMEPWHKSNGLSSHQKTPFSWAI
jgi:hypothetical protein